MENMVVMFPALGIGHLIPMVELGELITTHDPSLSITILRTPTHYETSSTANYFKTVTTTSPSITFHHLPHLPNPPDHSKIPFTDLVFQLIKLYKPIFKQTLQHISEKSTIKSVILDFMTNDAFEICRSLNLPTYFLFTSSACSAGIMLYARIMLENLPGSLKDLKCYLEAPGTPPIYSLDMPTTVHDRNTVAYKNIISVSENMGKSCGIIVNTFAALEPRVIKALQDGEYIPDGPTPPTYYVGPLIKGNSGEYGTDSKCLEWLSLQPSKSVVVLIFGSLGKLKKNQLMEIAKGLEKSEQRFLWVVRNPPPENETGHVFEFKDPDLDDLLPAGFLDRTKEKGLVVKNWAPQGEILRHDSVGGFVCHCGWNSVLEAMHAGVPLVAWPLYAEQKMNRVHLVEGIKVALRLKMSEEGFVTAEELAERLRELMEEESGRKIRDHVWEMSISAKAAVVDGGSSRVAIAELVDSLNSVRV